MWSALETFMQAEQHWIDSEAIFAHLHVTTPLKKENLGASSRYIRLVGVKKGGKNDMIMFYLNKTSCQASIKIK